MSPMSHSSNKKSNQREVLCLNPFAFHYMRYRVFGTLGAPIVIMVHGLTRTGEDFSALAEKLSAQFFVVCPDIVGRGDSDWLPARASYSYPQYLSDLTALINQIFESYKIFYKDSEMRPSISWIGTSMGGILGMILASLVNSPIHHLVLNDIGPYLSHASLNKIRTAFKTTPFFCSLEDSVSYLKKIYMGFGELTEKQWLHTASYMFRFDHEKQGYVPHYDPRILDAFPANEPISDVEHADAGRNTDSSTVSDSSTTVQDKGINLWPYWFQIQCPICVIRGSESNLLSQEILQAMEKTKPSIQTYEVPNAAHAPALMDDASIDRIQKWLSDFHNLV